MTVITASWADSRVSGQNLNFGSNWPEVGPAIESAPGQPKTPPGESKSEGQLPGARTKS